MSLSEEIKVKNIHHLGILAGLIDEIGIVEIINQKLGINSTKKLYQDKYWTVKSFCIHKTLGFI